MDYSIPLDKSLKISQQSLLCSDSLAKKVLYLKRVFWLKKLKILYHLPLPEAVTTREINIMNMCDWKWQQPRRWSALVRSCEKTDFGLVVLLLKENCPHISGQITLGHPCPH